MNKILFLLCSLALCSCLEKEKKRCDYITDYYQDVYEAELAYWQKDYDRAYTLLKEAESRCELLNQLTIYEPRLMARLCVKVGKPQEAFPYIERSLREGMNFDSFQNDPVFKILHEYEEWKYLKSKEIDYLLEHRKGLNLELSEEIMAMNKLDQKVRQQPIDYKKLEKVDSINQNRVKEIFKQFGYPGPKLVGNPSMSQRTGLKTLFFHFNDTTYFKPILFDFIRKGEAPADILGCMLDSQQRARGFFDYGIYDNIDSTSILNFSNLDKRRVAVGLRPWKQEKRLAALKNVYYDSIRNVSQ